MKDTFNQKDAAAYLAQCGSQDQVQDVLTAYAYAKFARGASTPKVIRKIEALVIYLRVTGLGSVVSTYPRAFLVVIYHLSVLNGGSIGALPTSNPLSHKAWNHARRVRRPSHPDAAAPSPAVPDPSQAEAEKWGARGPGCLIAMREFDRDAPGQTREDRLRLTALTPEEIKLLGPYAVPTFRSLTLPAYEDEREVTS